MDLTASMVITSLLLSLSQVSLLFFFVKPEQGISGRRLALAIALGIAGCTLARCVETREGLLRYASWGMMDATLTAAALLCRRARGDQARGIAQRVLCFFMLTECTTLALSYVCMLTIGFDPFRTPAFPLQLIAIAVLTAVHGLLLMLAWRRFPPEICADASSLRFSLLSALPYLFCCQITYWLPVNNTEVTPAVPLTMIISCALAFLLISSMEQRIHAEKERRLALAQHHMLELRQQQFISRRDSVETVRRTYHDMKNLLLVLEKASREDMRACIEKTLSGVQPFECVLETGSEAADILLGDKMAACQQEGITCTVMLDGALLSFIAELDLVTILSNAMDNAIEACRRMPQGAARYIQVRTREMPGFILLHVVNSCTGQARMEGSRFLTIKEDAENHGFGLSSIRHTAESYHGEMACRMEDGEFSLSLIFPREKMEG